MSEDVLTLTMNPAVDVCAAVEHIVPSQKLRCGLARRDAGGGGINVARVARRLGGDPVALFPAGGPIGQLLEHLVAAEGVRHESVPIEGDTREDFTIDEGATGEQYRFVLPGPRLSEAEQLACLAALAARLSASGYLVASGSLPPSVPHDFYALVAKVAAAAGTKLVLDSSGVALAAALGHGVHLIKPNLQELEELVGARLPDQKARVEAARSLVAASKCKSVALSLGEDGALFIEAKAAFAASAPKVAAVSTVGAGDSFLGALVWAFAHGRDVPQALTLAVAAGSAALLSHGTDLCHSADCERLAKEVHVSEI